MNSIFFLGGQFAPDGGGQFESDCIGLLNHLRGGQFDRCLHMYWKSISQQNLPVTTKYPEMVAEIYPHFQEDNLPDFGKSNLWFL
jgi:hypothetical protein